MGGVTVARTIKFRAWDKERKEMLPVKLMDFAEWWVSCRPAGATEDPLVHGERNSFLNSETDRHMLMQYTGMTDRNRNEIYDGDIVKDIDNGKIFEVFWNNMGCGTWWFATKDKDGLRCHARRIDLDDLEVIGNIYEHPNLLAMEDKA